MASPLRLRALIPLHLALLTLALGACGNSASDPNSVVLHGREGRPDVTIPNGREPSAHPETVERVEPTGAKPSTAIPPGPAPKKLVVRVLKKGSGSRVRRGDRIGARFVDVNYKTKRVQDFWGDEPSGPAPYGFVLGQGEVRKGWEIALPGKRLGTRLELLLPSRLAYGDGPMRYVVELIERERVIPDREGDST